MTARWLGLVIRCSLRRKRWHRVMEETGIGKKYKEKRCICWYYIQRLSEKLVIQIKFLALSIDSLLYIQRFDSSPKNVLFYSLIYSISHCSKPVWLSFFWIKHTHTHTHAHTKIFWRTKLNFYLLTFLFFKNERHFKKIYININIFSVWVSLPKGSHTGL